MTDTKHPAEVLAEDADHLAGWLDVRGIAKAPADVRSYAAMMRRIPALEAERDGLRAIVNSQTDALRDVIAERDDYLEQRNAAQEELRRCQQDAINLQAEHDMEMAGAKDVIGRLDQFLAMADAERDALRAEVELLKQTLRLARGAVLAEREACAQVAETHGTRHQPDGPEIAAAIRARGKA